MICPAEMLANNLIINAKGLVKIPTISIGIIIGIKAKGTPGGLNICTQYDLLPEMLVTINVIKDKTKVIAILPVTLAEPGRSPSKLFTKIKKNKVNK